MKKKTSQVALVTQITRWSFLKKTRLFYDEEENTSALIEEEAKELL